jgi:hypothetical protein
MQQIQEEYYKVADPHGAGHYNTLQPEKKEAKDSILLPPTPQQGELSILPQEVKEAMEQISQTTIVDAKGARNTQET